MTDQEIESIVTRVLEARIPDAGFKGAEVRSDVDFDGEAIIRVTARYERLPSSERDRLITAVHDLRDALIARGEERFVFLTNDVETERQHESDID